MLFLGLVFIALAIMSDGPGSYSPARPSEQLRGHNAFLRAQRYVSGAVFVGLVSPRR